MPTESTSFYTFASHFAMYSGVGAMRVPSPIVMCLKPACTSSRYLLVVQIVQAATGTGVIYPGRRLQSQQCPDRTQETVPKICNAEHTLHITIYNRVQ